MFSAISRCTRVQKCQWDLTKWRSDIMWKNCFWARKWTHVLFQAQNLLFWNNFQPAPGIRAQRENIECNANRFSFDTTFSFATSSSDHFPLLWLSLAMRRHLSLKPEESDSVHLEIIYSFAKRTLIIRQLFSPARRVCAPNDGSWKSEKYIS